MTTSPFNSWDHHNRPELASVGKGGKLDFKDTALLADVHGQHERLHAHQEANGYSFPPAGTYEWDNHPVRRWTGSTSPSVTRYWLSKGREEGHMAEHAFHLDAHLDGAPALGEHVYAFSGISHKFGDTLSKLKPGQVFYNPAPISTSISPGVAFRRSGASIISLSLPEGSHAGIYAGKVGGAFEHEHELLLKRQSPLVLVSRTKHTLFPDTSSAHHYVYHFELGE